MFSLILKQLMNKSNLIVIWKIILPFIIKKMSLLRNKIMKGDRKMGT